MVSVDLRTLATERDTYVTWIIQSNPDTLITFEICFDIIGHVICVQFPSDGGEVAAFLLFLAERLGESEKGGRQMSLRGLVCESEERAGNPIAWSKPLS